MRAIQEGLSVETRWGAPIMLLADRGRYQRSALRRHEDRGQNVGTVGVRCERVQSLNVASGALRVSTSECRLRSCLQLCEFLGYEAARGKVLI